MGGYYADPDTECQMFHVCVKVAGVGVQDFRFLCPNGTAFDQDHQICADWEDVDCDPSTLYYSSDNFDLYRVGSAGFESKAHKYGEDEETFALQRAETGDARINREPQTQVVNQQKDYQKPQPRRNLNNQQSNQEKDIFKTSSSSNFFNNRNNGKENDEDYDDNVNVNQNRDYEQRRKTARKPQRKPEPNYPKTQEPQQTSQTRRPNQRPTGFVNNFAGSSYNPTTSRPTTTTTTTQSPPIQVQQTRTRLQRPVNTQSSNSPTPTYTISTPAPFRQSPKNTGQYYTTSSTENYPQPRQTSYDIPKITKQQTENYPSNNPQYSKSTTPFVNPQYNTAFDKKPTTYKKQDYKPTTFSPNAKPFSFSKTQNTQQTFNSFPTTLAPRTQQAYTQIAQQTNTYNTQNPTFSQQNYNSPSSTTQKTSSYSQYTPTVPKITSTTPVSRSNRFDETQYDDGSYNPKYDYNGGGEEEFLKAAHSQNIASSRNELLRTQQKQQQQSTTTQRTTHRTHEIPTRSYNHQTKPTENYPKTTQKTTTTQKPSKPASTKKEKYVSYDYAYYDNLGPEPDYQIDTEIKKEARKN